MAGSTVARRNSRPADALFEDADIIFKNFAGKEKPMNEKGKRNFVLKLSEVQAAALIRDGFNVKYLTSKEEGEPDQAILKINVNFKNPPGPKCVMIGSKGKTTLDVDLVEMLDYVEFDKADIIITPYQYTMNGRQGISAYLKSIYVTIVEDALERKYADVPEWAIEAGDTRLAIGDGFDDEIIGEWTDADE
jgi:hypothetical protein